MGKIHRLRKRYQTPFIREKTTIVDGVIHRYKIMDDGVGGEIKLESSDTDEMIFMAILFLCISAFLTGYVIGSLRKRNTYNPTKTRNILLKERVLSESS